MALRARTVIFYVWLGLNLFWFLAGVRERDFQKKPKWLKQQLVPSRAAHLGEPALRLLRLLYGIGMAACWPLLANLAVVLLPVDRSLWLLSCLGVGHEEGVLVHALCGTAVWVWATAHALLTQAPMLVAGLWRVIVLPPADGSETKGTSNFMGLLAWLALCGLGVSSLAPLRRRFFDAFQNLHLLLAPAVLLFGCLHDSKVFWYSMLGAVLYCVDVVQRFALRRRSAVAVATVYPLPYSAGGADAAAAVAAKAPAAAAEAAAKAPAGAVVNGRVSGGVIGGGSSGSKFVVLRIATRGPPGCYAGQHVLIKVPAVSRWEWHPYSVAAYDGDSFALVVKAGGDWERRLCRVAEERAAAGGSHSAHLDVQYEGMYGTPDLQSAAAAADRVLLFAGGAGITPIASVLQSLLHTPLPPAPLAAADDVSPGRLDWAVVGNGLATHGSKWAAAAATGGGGGKEPPPLPTDPWVIQPAEVAVAAATAGGFGAVRVHLVWAVTQEADAQPLLPLLRAAAARGWRVDLHCTRRPEGPPAAVAVVCDTAAAAAANGQRRNAVAVLATPATAASPPPPLLRTQARPDGRHAAAGAVRTAGDAVVRPPWQLNGAAIWAAAAATVAVAAAGRNLGGAIAGVHGCGVAADGDVAAGTASVRDWVASVRQAFQSPQLGLATAAAAELGGSGGAGAAGGESTSGLGASVRRFLSVLVGSAAALGAEDCPASLQPQHPKHGDTQALRHGTAFKAAASSSVNLRVCRAWGQAAPELCVKCDPFVSRTPLERAWPCCTARVCFFGAKLAPLLGWVFGALLGAVLASLVWRWWAVKAAAKRRAAACGGRRRTENLPYIRAAAGGDEAAAPLIPRQSARGAQEGSVVVADEAAAAAAAAEEGAGVVATAAAGGGRPGLEDMLPGCGSPDGTVAGGCCQMYDTAGVPDAVNGTECGAGAVHVHVGRPDVEAYVRGATADASSGGFGGCGGAVYGVIVCGPESLQAAVQAAYEDHVQRTYPGSWFRGFSFTT